MFTSTMTNMIRSHRRKLPPEVMATRATAASGTDRKRLTPKYPRAKLTPMNSVTTVRRSSMKRSPTANVPHRRPKRSKIRRAWPARDCTQPRDHLLVHEEDGCEQQQQPEHPQPVVLTRLGVHREAAGIIVGGHHDHAGAHHSQQCRQTPAMRQPRRGVERWYPAEGAVDVASVSAVEHRPPVSGRPKRGTDLLLGFRLSRLSAHSKADTTLTTGPSAIRMVARRARGARRGTGPLPGAT